MIIKYLRTTKHLSRKLELYKKYLGIYKHKYFRAKDVINKYREDHAKSLKDISSLTSTNEFQSSEISKATEIIDSKVFGTNRVKSYRILTDSLHLLITYYDGLNHKLVRENLDLKEKVQAIDDLEKQKSDFEIYKRSVNDDLDKRENDLLTSLAKFSDQKRSIIKLVNNI